MKLELAIAAATKISQTDKVAMVVVDEGPHADEYAELPSYGYCPLDAAKTLYKYGKIVKVIN